ncbi:MAG: hypothetical protein K0S61_286 [Anaerocolumna sp.]|jgi:hypothetical protein|nr:hypothetical protein [Anaerocolumna sp.]
MRKLLLVPFLLLIVAILLVSCNQFTISNKSSPEQIVSYLIENIWNEDKQDKAIHAIELLMNLESDNKMQLGYEVVTESHRGSNHDDASIRRLIFQNLNKNNYAKEEVFFEILNKYSEAYFTTQDDVLADIIIDCFNYKKVVFYPKDPAGYVKKLADLSRDITESERLMLENCIVDENSSDTSKSLDSTFLSGLFTKLQDYTDSHGADDYYNYFSIVKTYFPNKYPNDNSVENVIDISVSLVELDNKLIMTKTSLQELIKTNGFQSTEQASKWIQSEYEKLIKDDKQMAEVIALVGTEEKAKEHAMKACILAAQYNGLYEFNSNDEQIFMKNSEVSELERKIAQLEEQLETEINRVISKYSSNIKEQNLNNTTNMDSTQENRLLAPVNFDGNYGFIDTSGNFIVEPKYVWAGEFSDELACINISEMDNCMGYINKAGEIVIEPQYNSTGGFSEGLAYVSTNGNKYGYIDTNGEVIIEEKFDDAGMFSEGYASIMTDGKWGYIDKDGVVVIKPQFDMVGIFKDGLARIKVGDKWGYIDKTGVEVIKPQFDGFAVEGGGMDEIVSDFNNGVASVRIGDEFACIDKKGNYIVKPTKDGFYKVDWWGERTAAHFSEGFAGVMIGDKHGYIDIKGNIVISPQFEKAGDFINGIALVKLNNKYGYIDRAGRIIIEPKYEAASQFVGDYAYVSVTENNENSISMSYGYINRSGEFIIKPNFIGAGRFR